MHMFDPDHRRPPPRYKPVQLFGTVLEERERSWLFAPEDDEDRAFHAPKSMCEWEEDEDGSDEGVMTIPHWLARKLRLITEPPADNDPVWWFIALQPDGPFFEASRIRRQRNVIPFPRKP